MKKPVEAPGGATATQEVEQFDSVADIIERFKKDPQMARDYKVLGEEKFLKKHLKSEEPLPAAGSEPPAPAAPEETEEQKRLRTELEERDRIIAEIRGQSETTASRLKKIEDENKTLQESLRQAKEKPAVEVPDLEGFKTEDLFDQDKAGNFLSAFKAVAASNKKMAEELAELKAGVKTIETKSTADELKAARENAVETERTEIDRVRRAHPEMFDGKRELAKVESDYVGFMTGLAKVVGFTGTVLDPATGTFAPEINAAYQKYNDEKAGAELKKKAEAMGVKMPEDFGDLLLVHKLRELRNNTFERDLNGQIKPWSYSKALEYHVSKQPAKDDPLMAEARRKKEAEQKAIENRKAFATELPAKGGADPIDLNGLTEDDFKRELGRYRTTGSEESKAWLEQVLRLKGMKDLQIASILKTNKRKG